VAQKMASCMNGNSLSIGSVTLIFLGSHLIIKPGVIVEFHFGRPLTGSILTIFLPSVILVILSQMIQVYVTDHIEMVIGVHLTILLVLATM